MAEENSEGNEGDKRSVRSGPGQQEDGNSQSNSVSSQIQALPVQSTSQNISQSRQLPPQPQMPLPPRPPAAGRQGHTGDDILHQYYVRGLLVLVIAVGIGYLYLHLESPSLSRHKLVPNEFSSFRKPSVAGSRKSSEQIKPVKTPPPPVVNSKVTEQDDSPPPVRHDSRGKPYIDPKFHEHSKYLSQVLHTLGDISRRMEIGENITKPIGGIVEMRAELLDEEEENENVPEYMKRLGSIIDDMNRSKTNGKYEKFKSSITKSQFSDPDKLKERNEKRKKWKEEMMAEQAEAQKESTYSWNPLDEDMEVVGENDDEIVPYELTEEDYAGLSGDEFKKIEENLDKFWRKYEEDMMEEEPEEDKFGEDDDIDSVGRKSDESIERLLERADKLKMGLEMLKVMFELEEKESSKSNNRRRSKQEDEKKPVFRDENSYTL